MSGPPRSPVRVLRKAGYGVRLSEHLDGDGSAMFRHKQNALRRSANPPTDGAICARAKNVVHDVMAEGEPAEA